MSDCAIWSNDYLATELQIEAAFIERRGRPAMAAVLREAASRLMLPRMTVDHGAPAITINEHAHGDDHHG